jgi:hypothetical protein
MAASALWRLRPSLVAARSGPRTTATWPADTNRMERDMTEPAFDYDDLAGKSAREIARILNERSEPTPTGKPWSAMTVIRAKKRLAA